MQKIRITLAALLCIVMIASESNAQVVKVRSLDSPDHPVVLELPTDWMITTFKEADGGYDMAHLVKESDLDAFTLSFLLTADNFTGTLEAYIDALSNSVPSLKGATPVAFTAKSGLKGLTVNFDSKNPKGEPLKQRLYVFSLGGKKTYLIVATIATNNFADDKQRLDSLVEAGLKKTANK